MADLGSHRYVSITTYRRDGTPVATPVWIVPHDGHLYVWTSARSGKAKRIRNSPRVAVAACTMQGTVTGPAEEGTAVILPDADQPEIWRALAAKYGLQLQVIQFAERLAGALRRRGGTPDDRVYLELTIPAA